MGKAGDNILQAIANAVQKADSKHDQVVDQEKQAIAAPDDQRCPNCGHPISQPGDDVK